MPNFAPEPWKSQGTVLDAYAALHGVPQVELSRLLNEEYLVELGSAFPEDVAFPAKPSNGNYRFRAYRWISRFVDVGTYGCETFSDDVTAAIRERWPSKEYTGYRRGGMSSVV